MVGKDVQQNVAPTDAPDARALYLDLLKKALRNELYPTQARQPTAQDIEDWQARKNEIRARLGTKVTSETPHAVSAMFNLPAEMWFMAAEANRKDAHTLGAMSALDNVEYCVQQVLGDDIPGDLIETGVYRGGQTIFMRGLLKAYGVDDRTVWVADSFEGLPTPDNDQLDDAVAHALLSSVDHFKVTEEDVRENFKRYGLLDDQVRFLHGWFHNTLPNAPISALSVLRLDGDYYASTRDALLNLGPKVSVGGFIIIDDYGLPVGCKRAVDELRCRWGTHDPIEMINRQTGFWRVSSPLPQLDVAAANEPANETPPKAAAT